MSEVVGAPEQWPFVVVLVLVLAIGLWLGLRFAAWRRARQTARSRNTGRSGEERALELLDEAGYEVLDTQVRGRIEVAVDGEAQEFDVRADALVRRKGHTWIAEFKGGEEVARIGHRGTRRQLLEYSLAFAEHRILLVDAARGEIHEVEFPGIEAP